MNAKDSFESDFRRLFDEHFGSVFRFLDRSCGDADLAADLTQETFVRLYNRNEVPDHARTWLISVGSNLLRDERRRRSRQGRLVLHRTAADLMADADPAPDDAVLRNEDSRRARRALDTMPQRDAQLLLLREEGLSYRELADMLGIHEASVGTLLARARATFRMAIEG